jgi:hypothetical protein
LASVSSNIFIFRREIAREARSGSTLEGDPAVLRLSSSAPAWPISAGSIALPIAASSLLVEAVSLENGSSPTADIATQQRGCAHLEYLHALAAPPAALLGSPATASCVKLIFATAAFKMAGEMGKE